MFDEKIPVDDDCVNAWFEDRSRADLDHFSYWRERLGRPVRLSNYHAAFKVEGETIVSTCLELEISSQGDDVREALRNLKKSVRAYLDTTDAQEVALRRRKVYVTDFVVTDDVEYETALYNDRVRIVCTNRPVVVSTAARKSSTTSVPSASALLGVLPRVRLRCSLVRATDLVSCLLTSFRFYYWTVSKFADGDYSAEVIAKVHGFTVDEVNQIWNAYRKNVALGRAFAFREIAQRLLAMGAEVSLIARCTDLTEEEVLALRAPSEEG